MQADEHQSARVGEQQHLLPREEPIQQNRFHRQHPLDERTEEQLLLHNLPAEQAHLQDVFQQNLHVRLLPYHERMVTELTITAEPEDLLPGHP